MRSLLVWLDPHCKIPLSASQLLNDSSVFPRRLALIDSSLLLSGRFLMLENLISAVSIQWSKVTHLYTNMIWVLSFFQMTDLQLFVQFSSFLLVFFFFFTVLEFPVHFTLWYGSQALSYLAIFLCVYFTYQNFSKVSMARIISRTPDTVWLIWNTSRFTPFVIGNCASINLNLNCICCCSGQITRKSSPILSLCNWFFELGYQDLHLPLSWRESDIHRFNGRKKRKRDWHHGAPTLPGTVTCFIYMISFNPFNNP